MYTQIFCEYVRKISDIYGRIWYNKREEVAPSCQTSSDFFPQHNPERDCISTITFRLSFGNKREVDNFGN